VTRLRLALVHRLMDGGSLAAAEATITEILGADPDDIEANILRAELLLRRGDTETARDKFRMVSQTAGLSDRTAAVAHAGLGAACRGLGEAEDATRSFAMAIDRGAVDTRTWLGLAEVFFAMGEWQALSKLAAAARAVAGLDWVPTARVPTHQQCATQKQDSPYE
jgi:Tfp pilus assembly protein PilF